MTNTTGQSFEVRAKQVINATGVWTDDTQGLADTRGQFHVRASKGIHLVVPRDRLPSNTGIILRTEKSVLFVIPWGDHWLIGDTDTEWAHDPGRPVASRADLDYLLAKANRMLRHPLGHDARRVEARPVAPEVAQDLLDHRIIRPVGVPDEEPHLAPAVHQPPDEFLHGGDVFGYRALDTFGLAAHALIHLPLLMPPC